VLVATTGNTGSAIANGFAGIDDVEVYILFPRGRVSRQQEAQFTTIGGNVHALEVQGTIDDCQRMVRQVFEDEELNFKAALTSANSLNIARLFAAKRSTIFMAWRSCSTVCVRVSGWWFRCRVAIWVI